MQINPNSSDVLIIKGTALSSLNKFEEGIECVDKALEIDPD